MSNVLITKNPEYELADMQFATAILDKLTKAYPGYIWEVGLDEEDSGGVLTIVNKTINEVILGQPNFGYVLKLSTVYADEQLKCVVRAGGEIIERAYLPRGKYKSGVITKIDGVNSKKHPFVRFA